MGVWLQEHLSCAGDTWAEIHLVHLSLCLFVYLFPNVILIISVAEHPPGCCILTICQNVDDFSVLPADFLVDF